MAQIRKYIIIPFWVVALLALLPHSAFAERVFNYSGTFSVPSKKEPSKAYFMLLKAGNSVSFSLVDENSRPIDSVQVQQVVRTADNFTVAEIKAPGDIINLLKVEYTGIYKVILAPALQTPGEIYYVLTVKEFDKDSEPQPEKMLFASPPPIQPVPKRDSETQVPAVQTTEQMPVLQQPNSQPIQAGDLAVKPVTQEASYMSPPPLSSAAPAVVAEPAEPVVQEDASIEAETAASVSTSPSLPTASPSSPADGYLLERFFAIAPRENRDYNRIWPVSVKWGSDNDIWLLDAQLGTVSRFSEEGVLKSSFGSIGKAPEQFQSPVALAIVDDKVMVLDIKKSCVFVFSQDGKLLNMIVTKSNLGLFIRTPVDILQVGEEVWVLDKSLRKLLIFNKRMDYLGSFTLTTESNDLLPVALERDSKYFYILQNDNRILKYTLNGNLQARLNISSKADITSFTADSVGNMWISDGDSNTASCYSPVGDLLITLTPSDKTKDSLILASDISQEGKLVFADALTKEIRIFAPAK